MPTLPVNEFTPVPPATTEPNEPVEVAEPLINVPEPLSTVCATNPPLIFAFSNVVARVRFHQAYLRLLNRLFLLNQ